MLIGMRSLIAGIVGLAVAAIVVLIVAGDSIAGKGIALALFGIACVVAVSRRVPRRRALRGRRARGGGGSRRREPRAGRGAAGRGSAPAAGAGPAAAYAAASAQLAAVTRLIS